MKRTPAHFGVLFVLGCVLAGSACSRSDRSAENVIHQTQLPTVPMPSSSVGGQSLPAGGVTSTKKGLIYVVSATGGDDNNLVAHRVTWQPTQTPALASLNTLSHAANSPLPTGTEIRGVKILDGLATVDFSREFQANFHGGDTQEAQTINSVLLTLGQFPSIERVQILVEGKPIDALSQLSISTPLDVIRPAPSR